MSTAAATSHHISPERASKPIYAPRTFNRRSRQRFTANRTAELIRHLGRQVSYPEKLLIARICSIEYWLRGLDARIDRGDELSGFAIRGRLAAETRLRLDLRDLGLAPRPPPQETFADHIASLRSRKTGAVA
jgi:hypothetical protein